MTDEIIINADDLMKIYEAELLRRYEAQATMSDDLIKALQKELRQADERIAELEAALNEWQKWWEMPWQYRRPDMADLCHMKARKVLGEKE